MITVHQLEEGHTLVLGTTGSGKTYQVRGMLEHLRRANRRVGAIDKLGNHWGLTLDRDGEGPGLDFVIFGGKRAMVPMGPGDGARLGRLFVERSIPAIFDLSQWAADDQEEWVAAFAETVFRTNEAALHLSIDEAQSFVPTNGGGDAYRAVRLLAEQGRGNGIRLLLACQRMARLDATVREMMHTVVAMRQVSPIDRKAVKERISADAEQAALIDRELPKLPVGTGYVWSAGSVDLQRVTFDENATFDSSKTPRHGDAPLPPVISTSALVEELRAALAPPMVDDVDDEVLLDPDPRISALKEENAQLIGDVYMHDQQIARLSDGLRAVYWQIEQLLGEGGEPLHRERDDSAAGDENAWLAEDEEETPPPPPPKPARPSPTPTPTPEEVKAFAAAARTPRGATIKVGGPPPLRAGLAPRHQRLLGALAWAAAYLKREAAPRTVVAWLAETTAASSTFERDCGALRTAGLIAYPAPGELRLTDAGAELSPALTRPRTRAELWKAIAARLEPRRVRLIEALWQGAPLRTRADLAAAIGTTATSSTFERDLGALRTLGLIDYPSQGVVRLAELLR